MSRSATVAARSIHPTAVIDPKANIGPGVKVGPYSVIGPNVRVGADTVIQEHAVLDGHTEVGPRCSSFTFASVGKPPQDHTYRGEATRLVIGHDVTIREFVTVSPGTKKGGEVTRIGDHTLLMIMCHIGHDCQIGDHVVIANQTALAGHVEVFDHAIVGAMSGIHQFCRIGEGAMVGAGTFTSQDIPPFSTVQGGYRARVVGVNKIGLRRRGVSAESVAAVQSAYRALYRDGLALSDALDHVEQELGSVAEVGRLVSFYRAAKRSVAGMRRLDAVPADETADAES